MNSEPRKLYYGYGLLSNHFFVERLLGRHLQQDEKEDVLNGFSLSLVDRSELPRNIQDDTPEGFQIYGLVEDEGGKVKVLLLELTVKERQLIRALNFEGTLYEPKETIVPNDGRMATIEVLRDQALGTRVPDSLEYSPFLRGWDAAAALADEVRAKVLPLQIQEGSHRRGAESLS